MAFRLFRQTQVVLNKNLVRSQAGQQGNALWGSVGSWSMRWSGGRRVFSRNGQSFGEQWYPDDDGKAYYFRLTDREEATGDSMRRSEVPFDPDTVGQWRLVTGGFQCKTTGEVWSRHFDEHDHPFYVSADGMIREWSPLLPQPAAPDSPRPPSKLGNYRVPGDTHTTHRTVRGSKHAADWRQRQTYPAVTTTTKTNTTNTNVPAVIKSRPSAPAPITPTLSYEVGTKLHLSHDWSLLMHRCVTHPDMKISGHTLRAIKDGWRGEFFLDGWKKPKGLADSVLLRLMPTRRGKGVIWVPASCAVLPEDFNASMNECPESRCTFTTHVNTDLEKHLITAHRARYMQCKSCLHSFHLTEIKTHSELCAALPKVLSRRRALHCLPDTYVNKKGLLEADQKLRDEENEKREAEAQLMKEQKEAEDKKKEEEEKKEPVVDKDEKKPKKAKGKKAEEKDEEPPKKQVKGKKKAAEEEVVEEKPKKKTKAKKEK